LTPPETIHVDDCLNALDRMFYEARQQKMNIPKDAHLFMQNAILHMAESSGSDDLNYKEFVDALQRCASAIEHNEASFFLQPRGRKVERLVDVIEFVESSEYLGMAGKVWPSVKDILWDVFEGNRKGEITEVVLGGCIGGGKSMTAELGTAYLLYDLSTYHSPQLEFGLAPGSSIYFLFQSVGLEKAKKVLFEQFAQRLRLSPYFCKNFPFNKEIKSELHFPNNVNIIPVASGDTSALGFNCMAAVLDEMNFQQFTDNSKKTRNTGEPIYDQAQKLYTTISRRIKSRFSIQGRCPGKVFLISSANYDDDFISRKVKEYESHVAEGIPSHIYVSLRSQWEARPREHFLAEEFLVEVGDATRRSRIVSTREEAIDPESVISVPMDFHGDFRSDIEAAIRDIAGIPVGGVSAFIRDRDKIESASTQHLKMFEGRQLFSRDVVDIVQFRDKISLLLDEEYLQNSANDPLASYVIHLDLAVSGDSCGVAVGRYGGMKAVGRTFDFDEGSGKYAESPSGEKPFIIVDGVLEIAPPQSDEIDLNLVADLVEFIASKINVEIVSADSYQSTALLQRFRRFVNCKGKRLHGQMLSVDRTVAPYASLKQAIRDERVAYPNCDKLKKELREVQFDSKREKVDHLPLGSKDLADPVAAVTYTVGTLNSRKAHASSGRKEDGVRRIRTGRRNIQ
jgi:hypothetical protein